jgi:dolichyl-phosphate beta-glucosyltransferase
MPYLRVLHETARGKGLAVRRGMLEARGAYRFICDADLSMPIEQVTAFCPRAANPDVVIGSREVAGSVRYNEPAYRHLIGRVFNTHGALVALCPACKIPNAGSNASARCGRSVFQRQTMVGMSFRRRGAVYRPPAWISIHEVPIDWYFDPDSRVRLVQDSLRMFYGSDDHPAQCQRQGRYGAALRPG